VPAAHPGSYRRRQRGKRPRSKPGKSQTPSEPVNPAWMKQTYAIPSRSGLAAPGVCGSRLALPSRRREMSRTPPKGNERSESESEANRDGPNLFDLPELMRPANHNEGSAPTGSAVGIWPSAGGPSGNRPTAPTQNSKLAFGNSLEFSTCLAKKWVRTSGEARGSRPTKPLSPEAAETRSAVGLWLATRQQTILRNDPRRGDNRSRSLDRPRSKTVVQMPVPNDAT